MLYAASLASGSSGNAHWVGDEQGGLLLDAGLSARRLQDALLRCALPLPLALLISHDHNDHAGGAGVVARRLGLPAYMSEGCWRRLRHRLGRIDRLHLFRPGDVLRIGPYMVRSFPTAHDACDPAVFVVAGRVRRRRTAEAGGGTHRPGRPRSGPFPPALTA